MKKKQMPPKAEKIETANTTSTIQRVEDKPWVDYEHHSSEYRFERAGPRFWMNIGKNHLPVTPLWYKYTYRDYDYEAPPKENEVPPMKDYQSLAFDAPYVTTMGCCGIKEIAPIYAKHPAYMLLANSAWLSKAGLFFFSNAHPSKEQAEDPNKSNMKGAMWLASLIERHKLGVVTKQPITKNPNTGNYLEIYSWQPDHDVLEHWLNTHKSYIEHDYSMEKKEAMLSGRKPGTKIKLFHSDRYNNDHPDEKYT